MRRLVLITAVSMVVLSGAARASVLCTTRDGKIYAGDKPPTGCKVKRRYKSVPAAHAASVPTGVQSDDFSVHASRVRTRIERTLNKDAASLEEIRERIEGVQSIETQGDADFLVTQQGVGDSAGFQSRGAVTLKNLRSEERKTLAAIAGLWKAFDELDANVVEHYGGKPPDWWRRTLHCPKCPSKYEAENAQK